MYMLKRGRVPLFRTPKMDKKFYKNTAFSWHKEWHSNISSRRDLYIFDAYTFSNKIVAKYQFTITKRRWANSQSLGSVWQRGPRQSERGSLWRADTKKSPRKKTLCARVPFRCANKGSETREWASPTAWWNKASGIKGLQSSQVALALPRAEDERPVFGLGGSGQEEGAAGPVVGLRETPGAELEAAALLRAEGDAALGVDLGRVRAVGASQQLVSRGEALTGLEKFTFH